MTTQKPDLTRIWAETAPPSNVVDPDTTTPGKVSSGWQAEVPPFEHFNFLQKWFTQGLAHFNEQGIGVWDTDTTYPVSGLAKGSDGIVYECLTEQNGNDPVSDAGTNWTAYVKGKVVSSYSELEALDISRLKSGMKVFVTDPLRGGNFIWDSSDLTAKVSGDPQKGIYVAPTSDVTGANGAYVRWFQGPVILTWFGATGAGLGTDDTISVKAAVAYCADKFLTLFVPAPVEFYYITSTVTLDNINVTCESPNSGGPTPGGSTVGNFKTDQNILVFRIYCDYNQIENINVEFIQVSPTSSAIGIEFCDPVDGDDNIRQTVLNSVNVRNAYTGFTCTSSGGTIAVMVMINCSSLGHKEWGFDFNATAGSTNITCINCYTSADTDSPSRKGMRFDTVKDVSLTACSIDGARNEGLVVTDCDTLSVDHLSFETTLIDTASARLVNLTNVNANIGAIGMQVTTVDVGVGNDATIVSAPSNTGWSCEVGKIVQSGTTIDSGTLYKHEVRGGLDVNSYVINDNLVDHSDIKYNGFDSRVTLNGKRSVPSFAFINGTHKQGDTVSVRVPVEAGAVTSKYIIKEYIKATTGASNVLNTDWFEGRVLTGN